jgi:two-component system alkaline phosphatase synthesis response regulator PhoP
VKNLDGSRMKRTVLVIDDNPDLLDMVDAILSDTGFLVAKTLSGEEGLSVARNLRPDLILLDLNMPRMDGWEVLRLLKEDIATKDIPVAIFSVRTDLRDKIFGLQRGAVDYIPKPFQYEHLAERVERILEHAK